VSIIGIVFYFSLGGNVLVQWGLIPLRGAEKKTAPWGVAAFMAAAAVASTFDGLLFRYVLAPWNLESLAPVAFAFFLLGGFGAVRALQTLAGKADALRYDERGFQTTLVLYAAAMLVGGRFSSVWYLLGGGAAAAFGYVAATRFLEAILQRLDLEPIPAPFRGAPIRFICAGLMALAFSGIDAGFFARFID
jgi:electron transport complex protein RnfA